MAAYYHHAVAATRTHSASSVAYSQLLSSKRMRLALITQHSEHPGSAVALGGWVRTLRVASCSYSQFLNQGQHKLWRTHGFGHRSKSDEVPKGKTIVWILQKSPQAKNSHGTLQLLLGQVSIWGYPKEERKGSFGEEDLERHSSCFVDLALIPHSNTPKLTADWEVRKQSSAITL